MIYLYLLFYVFTQEQIYADRTKIRSTRETNPIPQAQQSLTQALMRQ